MIKSRNTIQKKIILEELKNTQMHPTAEVLYNIVRGRISNISLGTIYRNLDILVKEGSIIKIKNTGSKARYDAHTQGHFHVICKKCGFISDIFDLPDLNNLSKIKYINDFEIEEYRLDFIGICKKCLNNNK